MMLEPEIKHFGRWERGQLFQYGENQDQKLDFFKYKNAVKDPTWARVSDNMKTVLGYSGLAFVAVVFGRFLRLSTLARGALRPTKYFKPFTALFSPRILTGHFFLTLYRASRGRLAGVTQLSREMIRRRLASAGLSQRVNGATFPQTQLARELLEESTKIAGKSGDELVQILGQSKLAETAVREGVQLGTKASGRILGQINKIKELGSQATAAEAQTLVNMLETTATLVVSPSSPTKTILLNGYKALSRGEMFQFGLMSAGLGFFEYTLLQVEQEL